MLTARVLIAACTVSRDHRIRTIGLYTYSSMALSYSSVVEYGAPLANEKRHAFYWLMKNRLILPTL